MCRKRAGCCRRRGKADGKDASLKQGAYGKVKIHKTPLSEKLAHPCEIIAALRLVLGFDGSAKNNNVMASGPPDHQYVNKMLKKVSRSFAGVIAQLPPELQVDVAVFYLALRALDTIEDDMTAFSSVDEKLVELDHFAQIFEEKDHAKAVERLEEKQKRWQSLGVGEGDEHALISYFTPVIRAYHSLPDHSRPVIADITRKMSDGMSYFVAKDKDPSRQENSGQAVATIERETLCETYKEYDLYCHYVAGLVGEGLSRLFSACGIEHESVGALSNYELYDGMGKFLQKTNIIRDYLEDLVDGRAWWPAEVYRKYAPNGKLRDFADACNAEGFDNGANVPNGKMQSRELLGDLVGNALSHAVQSLDYLEMIKHPAVFKFCAIPQVMAIATLAKCYDNLELYTGVCKIRKGQAARIVMECGDQRRVWAMFLEFTAEIEGKATTARSDGVATSEKVLEACLAIRDKIDAQKEVEDDEAQRLGGARGLRLGALGKLRPSGSHSD